MTRRTFLAAAAVGSMSVRALVGRALAYPASRRAFDEIRRVPQRTEIDLGPLGRRTLWTYDGQFPGREVRAREGDRIRVVVENELPEPTTIHWHGVPVPNAMDGVPGLTLQLLAQVGRTAHVNLAAQAGAAFLQTSRFADFTYGDEVGSPLDTALAVLALDARGAAVAVDQTTLALLGMQGPDGSWDGSVHVTGLVLRAIRTLHAPNLAVLPESAVAQPSVVTDGEHATVHVTVYNTGPVEIGRASVGVYAADGTALAPLQQLPRFTGAWYLDFDVDTTGRVGATQVFVIDSLQPPWLARRAAVVTHVPGLDTQLLHDADGSRRDPDGGDSPLGH